MANLTDRGYSWDDAQAFIKRSRGSHTFRWRAAVYQFHGGTETLVLDNLPLTGGTLTLDSSDPVRRQVSLEVGMTDARLQDFFGDFATNPLLPLGNVIMLWVTIDREDGSFFPWIKQGEFAIQSTVYEVPSEVCTIQCSDYAARVDEFLHLNKTSYANRSLTKAVTQMAQAALPDKAFAVHASSTANAVKVISFAAESGQGRWDAATQLAAKHGHECFFDSKGSLIIREDITDDDDDSIPATGPDIGTAGAPVAWIQDGLGGNLIAMTATTTRDGAVNGVRINVNATVTRRMKRRGPKGHLRKGFKSVEISRKVQAFQSHGPLTWGNHSGRLPMVIDKSVKKITEDVMARQQRRANRLLNRRRGVIRYLDIDAVGLYWLEPDDRVRIQVSAGGTVGEESHYVQRIEFDISGQSPVRIHTRQLNTLIAGGEAG